MKKGELLREGINPKELIYECMDKYIMENDIPPTVSEIAHDCKMAKSTIYYYLNQLVKDGKVKKRADKISRNYSLVY